MYITVPSMTASISKGSSSLGRGTVMTIRLRPSASKTTWPVIVYGADCVGVDTTARIAAWPPGSFCVLWAASAIAFSGPPSPLSLPCCQANMANATIRLDSPIRACPRRRRLGALLASDPGVVVSCRVPGKVSVRY
jgi:hypothetical protein